MPTDRDAAPLAPKSSRDAIADFLETARRTPATVEGARGRMIFALDATMSRQPTWDLALKLQGKMFQAASGLGGLDVQLVYFRGFGECRASSFVSGGEGLAALMSRISVRGGATQLGKVLAHARDEAKRARVGALVFVGDAMEEAIEPLLRTAGDLALAGVKAFMFQEGSDSTARYAFREIARITDGAYSAFDAGSAARLEELLRAAAAYASGGRQALEAQASAGGQARVLLAQMRKP